MSANPLLAHYERTADTSDAIPRIRQFILDLAVRGKLIKQDPNDEPATELLERIAAEKARLVKIKQIRKRKPLPEVDESPFDLPASWRWTRMRQITSDRGQTVPSAPFTYIDVTSIDKDDGIVAAPKVLEANAAPSRARKIAVKGDVIYSCVRPYLLNVAVIDKDFDPAPIVSTAFAVLNGHGMVLPRYLWIVLRSPFMIECAEESMRGQAYPAINDSDFSALPVPLPPFAEQQRIVARVDELMALCDRLEEAREKREAMRDRLTAASLARLNRPDPDPQAFRSHAAQILETLAPLTNRPDQIKALRQTVLNLAVRGRLVPQDTNDEPASSLLKRIAAGKARRAIAGKKKGEKSNSPVNVDDSPFDLPVGWTWARFPELGVFSRGKSKHRPRNDRILFEDGVYPFVQTGDVARSSGVIKSFTSKYNEVGLAQSAMWPAGTLCITIAANIADSGILSFDACFPDSVVGLIPAADFQDARYFEYFLRTVKADLLEFAPSTTQKNINLGILSAVLIPLPPLAEQRRIVTKVDELMVLCDRLETSLTAAVTTRRCLLDALLHATLSREAPIAKEESLLETTA